MVDIEKGTEGRTAGKSVENENARLSGQKRPRELSGGDLEVLRNKVLPQAPIGAEGAMLGVKTIAPAELQQRVRDFLLGDATKFSAKRGDVERENVFRILDSLERVTEVQKDFAAFLSWEKEQTSGQNMDKEVMGFDANAFAIPSNNAQRMTSEQPTRGAQEVNNLDIDMEKGAKPKKQPRI